MLISLWSWWLHFKAWFMSAESCAKKAREQELGGDMNEIESMFWMKKAIEKGYQYPPGSLTVFDPHDVHNKPIFMDADRQYGRFMHKAAAGEIWVLPEGDSDDVYIKRYFDRKTKNLKSHEIFDPKHHIFSDGRVPTLDDPQQEKVRQHMLEGRNNGPKQ